MLLGRNARGALLLLVSFGVVWMGRPNDLAERERTGAPITITNPLKAWLSKPGSWTDNPIDAFYLPASEEKKGVNVIPGTLGALAVIAVVFALAAQHGVQIRHLRPSVPTLEDVFAKAVGQE